MNRTKMVVSVLSGGCALTVLAAASQQAAVASMISKFKVAIPSLGHPSKLHPNIFDENGCVKLAPEEGGGVKCGPKQEAVVPENTSDKVPRRIKGFNGERYATEVDGSGVKVLADTISITDSGNWQARGLVRNEKNEAVGDITITASLFDASGTLLGQGSATTNLGMIRPGEPAPFAIKTDVPVGRIARFQWTVSNTDLKSVHRNFDVWSTYEYAFGSPSYRGLARKDAPYPYVLGTGLRNLEQENTHSPRIVVAWMDTEGKVIWVASSPVAANMKPDFAPNAQGFFEDITVSDPRLGPELSRAKKIFWVVAE